MAEFLLFHAGAPPFFQLSEQRGKSLKCRAAIGCAFKYSGVFEYMGEDLSHFLTEDLPHVPGGHFRMSVPDFLCPLGMGSCKGVSLKITAVCQAFFYSGQFIKEPGGQYCQTHDFDQADIFFFNMMLFRVGMENSQGIFGCGNVVAQHQIQFVILSSSAGDGSDGIVGLPLCLVENKGFRVVVL